MSFNFLKFILSCTLSIASSHVFSQTTWFKDADFDSFGDKNNAVSTFDNLEGRGYVLNSLDCDDTSPNEPAWQRAGVNALTESSSGIMALAAGKSVFAAFVASSSPNALQVKYLSDNVWSDLGDAMNVSAYPDLKTFLKVSPRGLPYVVFPDKDYGGRLSVKEWTGKKWQYIGDPGFTKSDAVAHVSLAIDRMGFPYVGFIDPSRNQLRVVKFDGADWISIGSPFADVADFSLTLSLDNKPFIGTVAPVSNAVSVFRFEKGNWITIGEGSFITAKNIDMVVASDGLPVVACNKPDAPSEIMMYRFDGMFWGPFGWLPSVIEGLPYMETDPNGRPCIVTLSDGEATIMRYDGYWRTVVVPFPLVTKKAGLAFDASGTQYVMTEEAMGGISVYHEGPKLYFSSFYFNFVMTASSITYKAIAESAGATPAFQWYKNGIAIEGMTDTSITLNLIELSPLDEIACVMVSSDPCVINKEARQIAPPFGRKYPDGIVETTNNNKWISVAPVPAADILQVQWNGAAAGKMTLQVCDLSGRVVATHTADVQAGTATVVPVQDLAAGVYCLRADIGGQAMPLQRFVKR